MKFTRSNSLPTFALTDLSLRHWFIILFTLAGVLGSPVNYANAQSPGVLYTWPSGVQDWFRNFGAGSTSATLANSGSGDLVITETSAAPGASQAFSDGFNTIRDGFSGAAGGLDVTGLSSLQYVMGHNGVGNVNVQFFTQATPGSGYVALGPDLSIAPGINTYVLPLTGLTADQITYMRTIGINIRDHSGQGNLTWTLQEVRSAGTPLTSRTIASHDGGPANFNGAIVNFDGGGVLGNSGQNNSGLSVVAGALHWTDLGGGPGGAIAYGNGTENSAGSFNARPVDLSNYDFVTVRMKGTGADVTEGVQFYMQTGPGFAYQSLNSTLTVDGDYHDLVFSLAGITARDWVDTSGVNLFAHANDLVIDIDSVIYSQVPEPASVTLLGIAMIGYLGFRRRIRQVS